ncbi:MAG TPA: hypothetical protein VD907_05750 [Verrucomicrobiae bacterium]|nr:hypothetical protein [Verrucomicrobiae bacterium]
MPKKQLTSNHGARKKRVRIVIFTVAALGAMIFGAAAGATMYVVSTGQGATATSTHSSLPTARTTPATTQAAVASASPSAPTTTIVMRTEVIETNPCKLVDAQDVFGAFIRQQSLFQRISPEGAPPQGPAQQRVCEYQSLSHLVKITTLMDNGQHFAQAKAAAQGQRWFWDAATDKKFAAEAEALGDDAFRTLNMLYFRVKAVTAVVSITPPTGMTESLTDHGTPLAKIGSLIAKRIYTLK